MASVVVGSAVLSARGEPSVAVADAVGTRRTGPVPPPAIRPTSAPIMTEAAKARMITIAAVRCMRLAAPRAESNTVADGLSLRGTQIHHGHSAGNRIIGRIGGAVKIPDAVVRAYA